MVKSISKKCLSILMILVLMFSIFTIPVHGEVLTMTTAVGVAVIAGALIAAGVYVASPQTRTAINAAAMDFINREASFLQTCKVVATATGKVFAIWGSTIWNKFTNWIKNVLGAGGVAMSGYPIAVVSSFPTIGPPFSSSSLTDLKKASGLTDWYVIGGGARLTNAYTGGGTAYNLACNNGRCLYGISLFDGAYYGMYNLASFNTSNWFSFYEVKRLTSSGLSPCRDLNTADRAVPSGFNVVGQPYEVYGYQGYFSISNGNINFGGHTVSTGWADLTTYLYACFSAGLFLGDFSWINGGMNVPVQDHFSPTVRVRYADNSIPGLDPAQQSIIGAIGGTLPYDITAGQSVITPVWGTWVNGDGIPIGWAGPQGTYGTPSSTITPGTTIAGTGTGTANPPITYPGDDVINPTLGRKGVATFPTIGDDVINPADDTFVTDLDDYIDPTIDRLTSPTDVTTLTQNPTDTLGPTTDVFPESDDIPNSIRDTATDTIPDVDSPAIPDVDTATDTATPINPDASDDTSTDERNTNRLKLSTLILSKFPFCIPWDIYRTVATMAQDPEIPAFDWRFSLPAFNVDETIHIDFEQFETVAYIVRWFLSACWLVTLVLLTRKVIWK